MISKTDSFDTNVAFMPRKPIDSEFICDRLVAGQHLPNGRVLPVLLDYRRYRGSLSIGSWNKCPLVSKVYISVCFFCTTLLKETIDIFSRNCYNIKNEGVLTTGSVRPFAFFQPKY